MPSSLHSSVFLHHTLKWSHLNSYRFSPQACEHKIFPVCVTSLPSSYESSTSQMPVLHHWCLNPSSVYSFVLLLTHTLEVTSSSSNREVISFTTVVVVVAVLRTLLPLARSMVSQNCRVAEYSSCAHAVPVSSRNRLKAGESPCRKPSAEHFSKLHPHQPNQAKWQMFPLSKGKQLASLVSSLFLFLRRTQTFLYCKFTTWVLKKHISQQFHELRLPVSSSYPDRNKLLRPQWYLGFLYKQ